MKLHVHRHTKGIKCDRCERTFSSQITLRAHVKRHASDHLVLECQVCDKTYSNVTALENMA